MRSLVIVLFLAVIGMAAGVPDGFSVYRNVRDFGAVGDGIHDDTAAFILAMTQGKATIVRPGPWNASQYGPQTTQPSFVFIPNGTYRLTETIPVPYYTQVVGQYHDRPVLRFEQPAGSGPYAALDAGTDEGPGNGWYGGANQDNFYRLLRNLVIDTRACAQCTGVHWMVSQATSISNTDIYVGHSGAGIYMESGSGGYLGDTKIVGGAVALDLGNQQFTFRNMTIMNSTVGVNINWNWGFTFFGVNFSNVGTAFVGSGTVGSLNIIDCAMTNVTRGLELWGHATTVYIENMHMENVKTSLRTIFEVITEPISNYIIGRDRNGDVQTRAISSPPRASALVDASTGRYLGITQPDSWAAPVMQLHLANGTDVTQDLQSALNLAVQQGMSAVLPYGTYYVSDTVHVPKGTRLYGQAWSNIMARGSAFANASNPKPVFRLGEPGDVGSIYLADLMFTSQGPVPGAVMIEVNIQGANPGDVAFWDVHFRVGGAQGTALDPVTCPTTTMFASDAGAKCTGARTLLHLKKSSGNVYIQNMWGWVADHDIDAGPQVNVFNGRGFVSEAGSGGVWMYGTAFEHSYISQYRLASPQASHMIGLAQTETPYYQPQFPLNESTPNLGLASYDPPFNTLAAPDQRHAYAMSVDLASSAASVIVFGTGFYSFFDAWNTTCGGVVTPCQDMLFAVNVSSLPASHEQLRIVGANTHGSRDVLDMFGGTSGSYDTKSAKQFPNAFCQTINYN